MDGTISIRKLISRFGLLALIFVIILVLGTIGFMLLESLSLFNAFYFTIITVATVGYGDIAPATLGGRILSIFVIMTGVGIFTALIVNAAGLVVERRTNKTRIERMNTLIGLFYSVMGNRLLELCLSADPSIDAIRDKILIKMDCTEREFSRLLKYVEKHKFHIDSAEVNLSQLKTLLNHESNLLVSLLENPSLIENELFTELLRATFHLREELVLRTDLETCGKEDVKHLENDVNRIYGMLSKQWFRYVHGLKRRYPYLYSLVVRSNPFNEKSCVEIQ